MGIWEILTSVPWLAPIGILAIYLFGLGIYKLLKDWLPW
jgi:hypothetical protein